MPIKPPGSYPDSELAFALVCPIGTDRDPVIRAFKNQLCRFRYSTKVIHVSDFFKKLGNSTAPGSQELPEYDRITSLMEAGNRSRQLAGRQDFAALAAISDVAKARLRDQQEQLQPFGRTALIINSIKRPEEVETLRSIYGAGFYLVAIYASASERLRYLTEDQRIPERDALALMERDENEKDKNGQRTRETFHLADVFIALEEEGSPTYKKPLKRFIDLVFGQPHETPTLDEHSMYLAYSAALRSGDLSRQVGAVITTESGDLLAVGSNDVPKPGGGLYWPGRNDHRDSARDGDANHERRETIVEDTITRLLGDMSDEERQKARTRLDGGRLMDITEYGRAVHAEMEAILSCARNGMSVRSGQLYTTTFPCHNCARHIVAAGLKRVVYVEPYPKSQASNLHDDAIFLKDKESSDMDGRVCFEPFLGIGPRRYVDLFSMSLGSGSRKRRKLGSKKIEWNSDTADVRVPMLPSSYIERERIATSEIEETIRTLGGDRATDEGQEHS